MMANIFHIGVTYPGIGESNGRHGRLRLWHPAGQNDFCLSSSWPGTAALYSAGIVLYLCSLPALSENACSDEPQAEWRLVTAYEDDGYRPLSAEEKDELSSGGYLPETKNQWRPEQQDNDCNQRSDIQSDDDSGYRPLNYNGGRSRTRSSTPGFEGNGPDSQRHKYGWSDPPSRDSTYSPAYPDGAERNIWSEGSYPYFTEPPMLPGYGVMPYSFGGKGSAP